MSKVRFDGLDVQAMVASLQDTLLGRRIVNVYDGIVGGETYVFKLEGDGSAKDFLLMESGIRFHKISNFQAEATSMPSPFAAKLRKHVRSLRLEQIQQIGSDRVVIFQFGVGNSKHCIILELYAKGNIVLTDKDYTVLALLRSHVYTEDAASSSKNNGSVMVQVGQVYPVAYSTMLGEEKKVSSEQSASLKEAMEMTLPEFHEWSRTLVQKAMESTGKRKKKQRASTTLKMLLSQNADSGVAQLGPALIEHCILTANIEPNANLIPLLKEDTGVSIWSEEDWCRLQKAFHDEAPRILDSLIHTSRGYVLYRLRGGSNAILSGDTDDTVAHADKILEEFQPLLLKQHQRRSWIEYNSFSDAVEDFFDHLQQQKIQQKVEAAEKAAKAKLEKIRADIQERLAALETQQQKLQQEAKVVQLHADSVDKALAVINSALDTGMDWEQLNQVIEVEQRLNKNPIALLIHKLDLEHEAMILRLPLFTSDIRTVQNDQAIDVRVSLNESAYSNANILFAKYRSSKEKSQKTIEASTKALKAAEETAMRQLADAQKRSRQTLGAAVIGGKRKPAWFEKFRWFITTENYLVLGGKDAHQNELLVKRYLRPGDAYLHADVQGAASCILRAKRKRDSKSGGTVTVPFSEQSLREAGNFTICHSSAWNSRMITSAWWVESHQVSKTAPTGECR
jgi:predicted ribosome quality control (RQC) complex YloA/Tae2 family protein